MRKKLVLTVVVVIGYAESLSGDETAGIPTGKGHIAIAWNDFGQQTGMLGAISASSPWEAVHDPISIGLDSVLHSAFGKLVALSAADRTVCVVDPLAWTVERTYVLAPGDEPIDIKVVGPDLAYLTRRNETRLLKLDLASGVMQEGVDLGLFADSDGIPEQGTMAVHDGRLFIQLQRLNFDEPGRSLQPLIAVMDLASEQLIDVDPGQGGVQAIELEGTFPKMKMQVVEQTQKLFVSATGAFFDSGGLELIDLDDLQTEGLAIREADGLTGADLGAFVMVSPDRGFLAFSTDLLLSSHLHQFSLAGGVDPAELAVALDYFSPAIEVHSDTNTVFFPVGGTLENGLHAFDADTGAKLNARLISTSGPPTDLIVLQLIPEPTGQVLVLCAWLAWTASAKRNALCTRTLRSSQSIDNGAPPWYKTDL